MQSSSNSQTLKEELCSLQKNHSHKENAKKYIIAIMKNTLKMGSNKFTLSEQENLNESIRVFTMFEHYYDAFINLDELTEIMKELKFDGFSSKIETFDKVKLSYETQPTWFQSKRVEIKSKVQMYRIIIEFNCDCEK